MDKLRVVDLYGGILFGNKNTWSTDTYYSMGEPLKHHVNWKKEQLELDMKQWTGSKLGKEYVQVVYCHPAYLTYIQSTSWEMLDESQAGIMIAGRNINSIRYADDTTLMGESKEELKSLLMRVKKLA